MRGEISERSTDYWRVWFSYCSYGRFAVHDLLHMGVYNQTNKGQTRRDNGDSSRLDRSHKDVGQ